ncbi:DUF7562 family protein [Halapricum salinum]|uniref:Small CPxCG-related zinc finger protein n=1 Tax=Halapricum salinum TaxID=1457250 RepID=A0A4D6HAI5_9EURY|nr:hypothetical protein [Halapricum salinum]QCC50226.1 hypothetical protein DV733_02800 [Halapricum salinum]
MFGSRRGEDSSATCPACGEAVDRTDAREYDKYGNRWERAEKEFEYLCKPCHRDLCHQPRQGLEAALVECEAGDADRETFLTQFLETATADEAER